MTKAEITAEIATTIKALVGSLSVVQGTEGEQNMNLQSLSAIYALQQEVAELTNALDEAMRQLFAEGDRLCEVRPHFLACYRDGALRRRGDGSNSSDLADD